MLEIVSFIQANSIFFICLAVVLVLAFIGYLAELSGYQKVKAPKEEKIKEKEEKKSSDELILDFDASDLELDSNPKKKKKSKKKEIEKISTEEKANVEEDLTVPMENLKEKSIKTEEIPEELYAPLGDTTFEMENQTENPIDASLPELDTIKDVQNNSVSEEDVWKF